MPRKTLLIIGAFGLCLSACTNKQASSSPAPTVTVTVTQSAVANPVPTVTITAPAPLPTKINPLPTVTAIAAPVSNPVSVSNPPAQQLAAAAYHLTLSCSSQTRRQSGATANGFGPNTTVAAVPGTNLSYHFAFQPNSNDADPVVASTMSCAMQTTQMQSGSEPAYKALLSCEGNATYDEGTSPPPTSAIARGWRRLNELTSGFTHNMSAPSRANEKSETDDCTLKIVNA